MREDVYKTKGQSPRWDGYLETLADHSQQPTGSPSMSTLPPSKSAYRTKCVSTLGASAQVDAPFSAV